MKIRLNPIDVVFRVFVLMTIIDPIDGAELKQLILILLLSFISAMHAD